jgi:putative DNA primase/helicase
MKHIVSDTVKAAAGYWPQLLPALGINIHASGRHGACPVGGGKDRFRFDNQDGRGTWHCNQCGAGDGLNLVEKVLDVSTKEAAIRIADMLGVMPTVSKAPVNTVDKVAAQFEAAAVSRTDNAYLLSKGLHSTQALTLAAGLRCGGISFAAGDLVVPLTDETGKAVNIQLISAAGDKRTLPGGQVKGAYNLAGQPESKTLWLAEGYATGLTVQRLTGQPVFVALSANNLPTLAAQLRKTNPDALM